MDMPKAIPEKTYDFKAVEDKLYQAWQNAGCFTPDIEPVSYTHLPPRGPSTL